MGGVVLSLDTGLSGPSLEPGQPAGVQLTPSAGIHEGEDMGKLPASPLAQAHPQEIDFGGAPSMCQKTRCCQCQERHIHPLI